MVFPAISTANKPAVITVGLNVRSVSLFCTPMNQVDYAEFFI